jgi:chaperonin cofactor prefoldin
MKKFIYNIVIQAVREVINQDVYKHIDALEQRTNARFEDLEQKMNARFDAVEARINSMSEDLANIKGNLEGEARAFHIAGYLINQSSFGSETR